MDCQTNESGRHVSAAVKRFKEFNRNRCLSARSMRPGQRCPIDKVEVIGRFIDVISQRCAWPKKYKK
jgi:hypothetical protein